MSVHLITKLADRGIEAHGRVINSELRNITAKINCSRRR
jgi:hypothetical protein